MKIRFLWAALIAAALCSTGLKATLFAQTLPAPVPQEPVPAAKPCPADDQDLRVAIQVLVIKVRDSVMASLGIERCKSDANAKCAEECQRCTSCKTQATCPAISGTPVAAFLNDTQVSHLVAAMRSDSHTQVMTAPRLMLLNGQKASLKVGQDHVFVTGMNKVQVNGQSVAMPQTEPITTGIQMSLQPLVSQECQHTRAT